MWPHLHMQCVCRCSGVGRSACWSAMFSCSLGAGLVNLAGSSKFQKHILDVFPDSWGLTVNIGTNIGTNLLCFKFEVVLDGSSKSDYDGDKWMRKVC